MCPTSFVNIQTTYKELQRVTTPAVTNFILVGLKSDLKSNPKEVAALKAKGLEPVKSEAAINLIRQKKESSCRHADHHLGYIECSARTSQHIRTLLDLITWACYDDNPPNQVFPAPTDLLKTNKHKTNFEVCTFLCLVLTLILVS